MEEQQQARARRKKKKKVAKNWWPAEVTVTAAGYRAGQEGLCRCRDGRRGEVAEEQSSEVEEDVDDDDDGGRDGQQKSNTRKAKRRGQNGAWRHFFRGGVTWGSRSDEKGKKKKNKDKKTRQRQTAGRITRERQARRPRLRLREAGARRRRRDDEQEEAEDAECVFSPCFNPPERAFFNLRRVCHRLPSTRPPAFLEACRCCSLPDAPGLPGSWPARCNYYYWDNNNT